MAVQVSKTAQDYVVTITVPIGNPISDSAAGALLDAHRQLASKMGEQNSADIADAEIARLTAAKAAKIDLTKV